MEQLARHFAKRLLSPPFEIGELVGIDINESERFFLDQLSNKSRNAEFLLGDIRDRSTLIRMMAGIDIVFHCAALKHVSLGEKRPHEIVKTNIEGIENIIDAAIENNVERVVFTSSDKAVNPTNVMGTSKLTGRTPHNGRESLQQHGGQDLHSFCLITVRQCPGVQWIHLIFRRQISEGGPITLTDKHMTRFVMTIEEAVDLVICCATIAKGGEVFVTKMPIIRISDLADVMRDELADTYGKQSTDIDINEIGSKPGEKLYEELMSREETSRALELRDFLLSCRHSAQIINT